MGKDLRDPGKVLATMHHTATGELLRLLEGFYFNIEDGLFELADRTEEEAQRRRCFDLMRELRFRKTHLIRHFAKAMGRNKDRWHAPTTGQEAPAGEAVPRDLEALIGAMAKKSGAHYSAVLQSICDRVGAALRAPGLEPRQLPISPERIAEAFVLSCRSLKFDHASIAIVQELFSRFVLERLGNLYGHCNLQLEAAGWNGYVDEEGVARA